MRILIVDDDAAAARSLADLLLFYGHHVWTAGSAAEALRVGETLCPEWVITDIGMPEVSGLEAARLIRQTAWGARARLVALTGWPAARANARIQSAGFHAYLRKPADIQQVLALLEPASESQTASDALAD
ncbi:response regulator [Eleftheria terrae]|uniref:response regulator n=1 Tax=Eleftheria terrae TaxID=1597781 RepID=UPI00263B8C2E|nr:response regulator [Eleftheria terrae]WKB52928.1 response regulator [Eleftheria terrae]